MEKISQLMDGELGRWQSKTQIKRLKSDEALANSWETYHLIGDALRREAELSPEFTRRIRERLESEPTVVAPRARLSRRAVRHAFPLAAGVAGVAAVAWLVMSFQQPGQRAPAMAAGSPVVTSAAAIAGARTPEQPRGAPQLNVPNRGALSDYLTAHQEFSPSTAMQGVAPYVRTVSIDESNAR